MEAVKQGSAAVGLRSNEYVVILGLKVYITFFIQKLYNYKYLLFNNIKMKKNNNLIFKIKKKYKI